MGVGGEGGGFGVLIEWQEMATGKTDDGLVGRFEPLDRGIGFCFEFLTREQGVEHPHAVKVESILVGPEVLKKLR